MEEQLSWPLHRRVHTANYYKVRVQQNFRIKPKKGKARRHQHMEKSVIRNGPTKGTNTNKSMCAVCPRDPHEPNSQTYEKYNEDDLVKGQPNHKPITMCKITIKKKGLNSLPVSAKSTKLATIPIPLS
jgi:hypothetical protein